MKRDNYRIGKMDSDEEFHGNMHTLMLVLMRLLPSASSGNELK